MKSLTILLIAFMIPCAISADQQVHNSDETDMVKMNAIRSISTNLLRFDSLYNALPDSSVIQKRVLKQIMQNDLMKIVIAEKSEEISSYQVTNAMRWCIGNVGLLVIAIVAYFFYLNRSKGVTMTIVLIVTVALYMVLFNFLPEMVS